MTATMQRRAALLLVVVAVLTGLAVVWFTPLTCSPDPLPGWAHYPWSVQQHLESVCGA